jgi:signal transduction histidine kinase
MTRRVLLTYLALTAFIVVVLGVPLGVVITRGERSQLVARVERDATVLASVVEDGLQHGVPVDYRAVAERYAAQTAARVVVLDADGISVGDSDTAAPRDFSTRPEVVEALGGRISTGYRHSDTLDTRLLYVAVPVASGGLVHGAVRITYPTAAVDARIRRSWLTLVGVSAVALAAAAVVGAATARWASRPVRQVHATAARLAAGDLSARAGDQSGPPEIRALARTLDQMAARLDDLLASQRMFVADASHQLRSPLTALRLRLEGITATTRADRAKLEAALDETARLARLLDGLLTLARAEGITTERGSIDVVAVITERVAAWEPLAAEADVRLRTETPGAGLHALALPGAVEQVLDNYLANALAVAPAGSTVEVRSRRRGDLVTITVADQGPGLTEEERTRAFDRFWRGTRQAGEGFGLGLPIVARLATASGGHAELAPSPTGQGTVAVFALQAAPQMPAAGGRRTPVMRPG